jgi:hypothetical protein
LLDLRHVAHDGADVVAQARPFVIDGLEVDPDDVAARADELGGDLEPRAGGAPEVEDRVARADQPAFVVDLDEFVGGAGEIALGFGLLEVPVVEASACDGGG